VSRRPRAVLTIAVTLALAAALTACTKSKPNLPTPTLPATTSSAIEPTPTDTTPLIDTTPPSSTATATGTSPAASGSAPTLPKGTCTGPQLTVRVIEGGADTGREIALITFTNRSAATCSIFGFPGVSLRLNNVLLGSPAERTADLPTTVKLLPGEQGQAQLTDYSSCQAPLSDTVRVYPPNLTTFVDKPFQLRGCRVVVAPVTHS
jgi:hypothetical protein